MGRKEELLLLERGYASARAELMVLYGRRRVGKSALVRFFCETHPHLMFEGIEGQTTQSQVESFTRQLKSQIQDPLLQKARFDRWEDVFDYLTGYFRTQSKKQVVFFDEFQWMAAGHSKLVSLIKYYWDNHWKHSSVMLILCGSIASFMVKKVIRSKALYGRATLQMKVRKLSPRPSMELMNLQSCETALRFLLVFGGVPKYLEEVNSRRSFEQNLEHLFFEQNSIFLDEFSKIFNVHFKEPRGYLNIIHVLNRKSLSLEEIAKALKVRSSGGLKTYLENLELADFIRSYNLYDQPGKAKYTKYRVSDEFILFYLKYVQPNLKLIENGSGKDIFRSTCASSIDPWLGFVFENFCINQASEIARLLEFNQYVMSFGPLFQRTKPGFQIDLLFKRKDRVIVICEIKHQKAEINTQVIPEVEAKIKKFKLPKGYTIQKALISSSNPAQSLVDAQYFDYFVTAQDLFKG